jgi:hypothetical protein
MSVLAGHDTTLYLPTYVVCGFRHIRGLNSSSLHSQLPTPSEILTKRRIFRSREITVTARWGGAPIITLLGLVLGVIVATWQPTLPVQSTERSNQTPEESGEYADARIALASRLRVCRRVCFLARLPGSVNDPNGRVESGHRVSIKCGLLPPSALLTYVLGILKVKQLVAVT